MTVVFHPKAIEEFEQTIQFDEERETGLGLDFAGEVYAAISRIMCYPEGWASISASTRRVLVSRFPYGVIFQEKDEVLRIIAVAALQRKPGY